MSRSAGLGAFAWGSFLSLAVWSSQSATLVEIGLNFTGSRSGVESDAQPPDANGAVGPKHFVELINGRYSVYDKTNARRVQTKSDVYFWADAGVTLARGLTATDPRIAFDTYSERWFASAVDASLTASRQTRNRFLLAVSATNDPTGAWHAFAFTADPVNGDFADFPTLGLDRDGVYLSGDMFTRSGLSVGPSLISLQKSALLADPPSIAERTSFGILPHNTRGYILQPAITTGAASAGAPVLAVSSLGSDPRPHTTLLLSTVRDAASNSATLLDSTTLAVPNYSLGHNPSQPDGSTNLDGGDARFGASVRRVGDTVYAVHTVDANQRTAIRWYRINTRDATVQSGTLSDPELDLFYPSIAANESGTVVIACNGSSLKQYVSCYASIGQTIGDALSFGDLVLLKAGSRSYQSPDTTGQSRWGDYSATTVDPEDSSRFWTIQTYPAGAATWATQITELVTAARLTIVSDGTNLLLSWPASSNSARVQFAPSLSAPAQWSTLPDTPIVSGAQATITLPASQNSGFFRLVR